MAWIVDHSGLIYLLLAVVALILGSLYYVTRENRYLRLLAGVGCVAFAVWLLGRFVVTDRQQVQNNLLDLADAFVQRDTDRVMRNLSKDFEYHGKNVQQIRPFIKSMAEANGITDVYVSAIEIVELSRPSGKAKLTFRVRVDGAQGTYPGLCRSEYVLENDRWVMRSFALYPAFGNSDHEFVPPWR